MCTLKSQFPPTAMRKFVISICTQNCSHRKPDQHSIRFCAYSGECERWFQLNVNTCSGNWTGSHPQSPGWSYRCPAVIWSGPYRTAISPDVAGLEIQARSFQPVSGSVPIRPEPKRKIRSDHPNSIQLFVSIELICHLQMKFPHKPLFIPSKRG